MIRAIVGVIGLQVAVALGVAVLFLVFGNEISAKSALIGGATAFIPSGFYAARIIRSRYGSPDRLLRAHYAGELGKLLLTAFLFSAAFVWVKELSALPLFVAYIATLLVYWVALAMFSGI